jgi:hypothetical protein
MSVLTILTKASHRAGDALRWIQSVPTRVQNRSLILAKDLEDVKATTLVSTPRLRQQELAQFYDKYEQLVELLCDSAQYGPDFRMEQRYAELRGTLHRQYPDIRRFVSAFLEIDLEDSRTPNNLYEKGMDAFEALWSSPTLQELLRSDDGNMISRITRTREALNRYAEQLRQIAA